MVTMPSEAAAEPQLIESFLAQGMTMMRINCAHDHLDAWAAMLDNLRRAEAKLGKSCRLALDLAGPKLRTGAIEPGPEVMRFKPTRDALGRVLTPAMVRFSVAPDDDDEAFTEVTDAAMSCRAECVMLNKGPYMSETIRFLSDVSQRMSQHRVKRVATLRRLSVADAYQLPSQP